MNFSYSPLEYQLIKLAGPKITAQKTLKLPHKMLQPSNWHSDHFVEAHHTAVTMKNSVMYRA